MMDGGSFWPEAKADAASWAAFLTARRAMLAAWAALGWLEGRDAAEEIAATAAAMEQLHTLGSR